MVPQSSTRRSWLHRLLPRRKKPNRDAPLSANTLRMIDEAAENFREGIVGPPVDPDRLRRLAS
ncbi:MAG TPA: hypothetical protein VJT67_05630 [Longimicrobiaceae bacterium]|nr:hypothetical protein [Longimicrobiaceae bacterium]